MNNNLSPHIEPKNRKPMAMKRPGLGQAQIYGGIKPVNGIPNVTLLD
jgi:hypothetical protein